MAALHAIRLLKGFRSYRCGDVIQVPSGLAEQLVEDGLAVREPPRPLLEQSRDGRVERAVAPGPREVR